MNSQGVLAWNNAPTPPGLSRGFATRDRTTLISLQESVGQRTFTRAINDLGLIVGAYENPTTTERQAFLFNTLQPATPPTLLTAPSLQDYDFLDAVAINNQNKILIKAKDFSGINPNLVYVYDNGVAEPLNLIASDYPAALNNLNHYVGTTSIDGDFRAVLIRNGSTINLQSRLETPPNLLNLIFYQANHINDAGEILVKYAYKPTAQSSYVYRFAVLQPVCQTSLVQQPQEEVTP